MFGPGAPVPPGWAISSSVDQISSGACGAHDSHPAMTSAAADHGQLSPNETSVGASTVVKVNAVAIPKLPPPPPWLAQNRSRSSPLLPGVQ